MSQTWKLFQIGLRQIIKDGMLLALLPAPIIIGLFFKFAIPFANNVIQEKLHFSLMPWYGLLDGMLICLTPMMTAMIFAFLLLEERDEGVSTFYRITPTGRYIYLTARIGIPMIWALIMTILSTAIFNISELLPVCILLSSVLSTLMGLALSMMVVSIAQNRVEGLAVSKLMGVSFLGLPAIWLIPVPYQFAAAFLPSYWIGKIIIKDTNIFDFTIGICVCALWIIFFSKRFIRQVT